MSLTDLFTDNDPYDINLTIGNDSDDGQDFEITEDHVKEMLFDDSYGNTTENDDLSKTPADDCLSSESGESRQNSAESSAARCESNLITLTDGEDSDVKPRIVDLEDEDEEEEDEERHSKFKSERIPGTISLANPVKQTVRDIPDSLDKVVVPVKDIKFMNKKKGQSANYPGSYGQQGVKANDQKPSPHKIHLNPHFRAPLASSSASVPAGLGPHAVERTMKPNLRGSAPMIRPNHHSSSHSLLPTPTSFASNENVIHNFRPSADLHKTSFTDQLLQNHSMNHQPLGSFSPNRQHYGPPMNPHHHHHHHHHQNQQPVHSQQTPQPFNSSGYWPRNPNEVPAPLWVNTPVVQHGNHSRPPLVSNPLLTQPCQYPQNMYPSSFPCPPPGPQAPYFNHPGHAIPPQMSSHPARQPPMYHQELPNQPARFLPQQVFAARFPQQYPSTRPELNSFPRPEPPIRPPPRAVIPQVERFQVPLHHSEPPRALLPRPLLASTGIQPNPPRQLLPNAPRPPAPLPRPAFSSDFGVLQQKDFFDNRIVSQYKPQPKGKQQESENDKPAAKKFAKNPGKAVPVKLSALKTVCNGTDDPTKGVPKVKMAKKYLQKRTSYTSIKQIALVNPTSTGSKTEEASKEEPQKKPEQQVLDIEIDEEYKKKLEEQKRMREQILKRKEERRRLMALQKLKEAEAKAKAK